MIPRSIFLRIGRMAHSSSATSKISQVEIRSSPYEILLPVSAYFMASLQ